MYLSSHFSTFVVRGFPVAFFLEEDDWIALPGVTVAFEAATELSGAEDTDDEEEEKCPVSS